MSDLIERLEAAVGEQCTIRLDYPATVDLILETAAALRKYRAVKESIEELKIERPYSDWEDGFNAGVRNALGEIAEVEDE